MISKTRILFILLLAIFLLPLWMWLAWLSTPKKKLVAAIVDKTVLTEKGQEHVSFTWVLNHQRYTKSESKLYSTKSDYFGFFPQADEKFKLKGLERFSPELINKLSNDADLLYLTDTYGIYRNEWFKKKHDEGGGKIYGGMSEQDLDLLKQMKEKKKLVITEFNTIGSPTHPAIRSEFENLFGIKWSGWIGRYFPSFDTSISSDVPKWLVNNYMKTHNGKWPFKNAGIAFINIADEVVIAEEGFQLITALPVIEVSVAAQKRYNLPNQIHYPFWFDIIETNSGMNKTIAEFSINASVTGIAELKRNNIPIRFPAIARHYNTDYQFYYFSGDFCDNPVSIYSSYFKGVSFFKTLFYDKADYTDRGIFFWDFYNPLMTQITKEKYKSLQKPIGENTSGK